MRTSPFLGPPKVARNLTRSFLDIAHKRCNSNDAISKSEIRAGELRATLLRNHRAGAGTRPGRGQAGTRPGRVALAPRGGPRCMCTSPFLGPPKVARNLTRSFLDVAHKRCNSNDAISKPEIRTGELRATLLRNHGVGAGPGRGRRRAGASPRPLLPAALLEHLLQGGGAARVDLLVGDLFGGGQQVGGVRVWRRVAGP